MWFLSDAKVDEGDDYGDIFVDDDLDNDEEGEKKDDRGFLAALSAL